MNYFAVVLALLILACASGCHRSQPAAQSKPIDPCQQGGVSYAPVGRIVRMGQMPFKEQHDYGTHVLLDASSNIQFVLQAPNLKLDSYAEDGKWYRVDGHQSPDHSDLFIVCAVSPTP